MTQPLSSIRSFDRKDDPMTEVRERDLTWGADCDRCTTRLNASRAQHAAQEAGDGPLLCGSCRDEERLADALTEVQRLREEIDSAVLHRISTFAGEHRDYGNKAVATYLGLSVSLVKETRQRLRDGGFDV